MKQPSYRIEIYQDEAGEYRSRIRHRNGNIIMASAEGYTRMEKCVSSLNNFLDELHAGSDMQTILISKPSTQQEEAADEAVAEPTPTEA